MRHLLRSLIISIAVIGIASPSFAGDDRDDNKWDRDKKEQSHQNKKDNHDRYPGNPLKKIMKQLDDLNDKLDDLLANGVDLRGVTQNWDKKLDSTNGYANGCDSDRFTCIWPTDEHPDGAAVRDNETGLVWERSPDIDVRNWYDAIIFCGAQEVGGRKGWHLPLKEQLASLIDPSNRDPALPSHHPFINIQNETYHTATTAQGFDPTRAWAVQVNNAAVFPTIRKIPNVLVWNWCVRGGQSFDGQDLEDSLN